MKKIPKIKIIEICLAAACAAAILTFIGCVSAEKSGEDTKTSAPVQTIDQPDTVRLEAANEIMEDTVTKQQKVAPTFKSNQDTVQAEIVKKSKSLSGARLKENQMQHSVYTVQIGAYSSASHALKRQKAAKEKFEGQPVFNKYEESAKLYRVSIGMYENQDDALALCDSLKQKYPDEFKQCWVNYIP